MHDFVFAASIRPPTPEILGLRMLPYTVGHEILLQTEVRTLMALPPAEFAALPLNQRVAALYRAVLICSTDYHSHINAAPRRVYRKHCWGIPFLNLNLRVKLHHWVNVWTQEMAKQAQKQGETFWETVENDLRNHILTGRRTVPVLSSAVPEDKEAYEIANKGELLGGEGRTLGAPLLASLLLFIEKHPTLFAPEVRGQKSEVRSQKSERTSDLRPPTSVFDVPYAFALNLFFTELESTGALPIENPSEAQARAEMEQHRVELRAEKAKQAEKKTELTKSTELKGAAAAAQKNSDHSVNSV